MAKVPEFTGDFESGWGDWGTSRGVWQIGTPTSGPGACFSGSQCAGTNLSGNYWPETDSRLISATQLLPTVSGSEEVHLRFQTWFSYYLSDSGQVQIAVWDSASSSWGSWENIGDVIVDTSGWSQKDIDVSAYAGKTVRLAFTHTAVDYGGSSYYGTDVSSGWYIDDIEITSFIVPTTTAQSCSQILASGESVGDGTYLVDPDGVGGQDPFSVNCLMTLDGGGWTQLTDTVSSTIINTDTAVSREYLYVKSGLWYRSPASTLVWDWNSGQDLIGTYSYSGGGSFVCNGSSETTLYGVSCSNGSGNQFKALIRYNTGKDPANALVQLCQDQPGIFGTSCQTGVTVYIR